MACTVLCLWLTVVFAGNAEADALEWMKFKRWVAASIRERDAVAVDRLLSHYPGLVNEVVPDTPSITFLALATSRRAYCCMKVLIDRGAKVDLVGKPSPGIFKEAQRPLVLAVINRDAIATEKLLKKGAAIHVDGEDISLIHFSYRNSNMVDLLVEHGADINSTDKNGETPLSLAVAAGDDWNMQLLLNSGAKADQKAIHKAIWQGSDGAERVGRLLSHGAPLDLMVAVFLGNVQLVKKLHRKQPIDVEASNAKGALPLRLACRQGDLPMARLLIEFGLDPNARDFSVYQTTPFDAALESGRLELVQALLTMGATVREHRSPELQLEQDFKKLFSLDDIRDEEDSRAWSNALDHFECNWLKSGARVDYQGRGGLMPLHYAACKGDEALVRVLLDKGADPNLGDSHGNTPWSYSRAGFGHREEVQVLLLRRMYPIPTLAE